MCCETWRSDSYENEKVRNDHAVSVAALKRALLKILFSSSLSQGSCKVDLPDAVCLLDGHKHRQTIPSEPVEEKVTARQNPTNPVPRKLFFGGFSFSTLEFRGIDYKSFPYSITWA